jgi:hypothetical protein
VLYVIKSGDRGASIAAKPTVGEVMGAVLAALKGALRATGYAGRPLTAASRPFLQLGGDGHLPESER